MYVCCRFVHAWNLTMWRCPHVNFLLLSTTAMVQWEEPTLKGQRNSNHSAKANTNLCVCSRLGSFHGAHYILYQVSWKLGQYFLNNPADQKTHITTSWHKQYKSSEAERNTELQRISMIVNIIAEREKTVIWFYFSSTALWVLCRSTSTDDG